jgi:hypothetical protein
MPIIPASDQAAIAALRHRRRGGIFPLRAAEPEFDPRTIPGLALWFDGDTAYTTTGPDVQAANGESVSRWPDLSGNQRHANQATGSNKPLYSVGAANGHGALSFDGFNDFVALSTGLNLLRNVSGATMFVTAKATSGTVSSTQREFGASNGSNVLQHRAGLQRAATNTYQAGGRRLDANSFVGNQAGTTGTATYIHAARFDYVAAVLRQYLNGSLLATSDPFQTTGTTSDTDSLACVVGAASSGGEAFPGLIFSVLCWGRALTDAEVGRVHAYLGRRYGVVVS